MKREFVVGQSNEIVVDGRVLDLHNHYKFDGVVVLSDARVLFWFSPDEHRSLDAESVVLEVSAVDFLTMGEGVATGTCRHVDEIGFKPPGDNDLDWLSSEQQSAEADHLVIRFGVDNYARVHGSRAKVRLCSRSLNERIL